ncbi:SPOR domain-containing protein [Uliginosibacterium sp. H3]|uniref:SPOR domain-containing protein n=1 Tax=Uliginosibacterium silvisoli TaxID=3114758 RepID=A0ABU6K8N5_9RHOO|nr:SPOR domain-containing protein [Uliginosibacterium sp. H3]
MADTDAQLELKKRARRRLIGAIALVLAAAVFLPMVMDSEPHSGGNDLQIRIPSQEGSNYTSRLITTAPGASVPAASPQPAAPLVPPTDPEMPTTTVASSSAASMAVPAAAAAPSATSSHAASSKPAESSAKSSISAEARAKAALEGEALPVPATETRFFVQLGAYRDPENVKSVQAQLKRAGMTATTDKVGDKTRVRVGPFKTRQAADAAATRLKQGGLNGVVTTK